MRPDSRIRAALLVDALLGRGPAKAPPSLALPRLDARDERFAAELAHGVVRHLIRIDRVIARAAGKPTERIAPPALAAARIGVYQLLFTPSVPPYAAVSASVELARALAPKTAGFVNWLLRRIGPEALAAPRREEFGDAVAWLAALHSFPPWLVRRWVRRLGEEEAGRLLEAMNEHPPPHLRANPLRTKAAALRATLAAEGFAVDEGRYAPGCLHARGPASLTATTAFAGGQFYIQDESSQLAGLALAPRPGERVLDACAGVGGKTTQIAELAGNGATIVAVDHDRGRLARLVANAERLGAGGIETRHGDLLDTATLAGERFDAVLLDAPCSALGTIPRHPEIKWTKRPTDPARLAPLQLRLLARAGELVDPGGRIVYSTCSTEPEEGEEVIARFLAAHGEFATADPVGGDGDQPEVATANVAELLTPEGFLRTWPHRHGIGGAFVACLRRRSSSVP